MAALIYHIFTSSALVCLGLYHLICSTCNQLSSGRSPHPSSFSSPDYNNNNNYHAKPYHPFPPGAAAASSSSNRLKHLQLYLLILCLLVAFAHQAIVSTDADPLLKGHTPVHRFTSLQSAAVLFLFLLLSLSLLITNTTSLLPFPSDLFFALSSAVFFLQYAAASASAAALSSDLESKCDSLSARISALSSLLCLLLACQPRLFVADVALAASLCLQGLWSLQTGLSLYVEAFIPEGCHRLLDVVRAVEGSTKCDLEESRLRAVAILDLAFVVHVVFTFLIVFLTYAAVAKSVGIRRYGSYEALPAVVSSSGGDANHVQMKTLAGTQA